MSNTSLSLLVLKTDQLEALLQFYTQLGIAFVTEKHGNGPEHYAGKVGNTVLEIYPLPENTEADSTTRIGFDVADLDCTLQSLQHNGYSQNVTAKHTKWGYRAVVQDPDGRSIELYEKQAMV